MSIIEGHVASELRLMSVGPMATGDILAYLNLPTSQLIYEVINYPVRPIVYFIVCYDGPDGNNRYSSYNYTSLTTWNSIFEGLSETTDVDWAKEGF